MPITCQQFDHGIDNAVMQIMESLARYLQEHNDQAFSRDELGMVLGIRDPGAGDPFGVNRALANLPGMKDNRQLYWDRLVIALRHLVESPIVQERNIAGVSSYARGDRAFAEIFSGSADIQPEKES